MTGYRAGYTFGAASERELATVDPRLGSVARAVIVLADHKILQGARTIAQQRANVASGVSRTMQSKHLGRPAMALDFAPFIARFGVIVGSRAQFVDIAVKEGKTVGEIEAAVREQFTFIGGLYVATGAALGVPIVWGGDWDSDGDVLDNRFDDLGHVECATT